MRVVYIIYHNGSAEYHYIGPYRVDGEWYGVTEWIVPGTLDPTED